MILTSKYKCIWYILDNSHRLLLGTCYFIFGLLSLLLNVWLASAFLQSRYLTLRSHLLLLNVCVACIGRSTLAGFPFAGTSSVVGRWVFGDSCCQLFAFLKNMLGTFQMSSLTILAVERWLISRRHDKAEELPLRFYILGMFVSWTASVSFSIPPLLGFGAYRCDVTGAMCDVDWRMMTNKQMIYNTTLIILGGVVPIVIIYCCLYRANRKNCQNRLSYTQKTLTKTVVVTVIGIFLLWLPQGILIFWIITGLGRSPRTLPIPLAVIAPLSSEAANLVPVLSYLAYDERIRAALLNMVGPTRNVNPRTQLQ